jgi:hypothetical protein
LELLVFYSILEEVYGFRRAVRSYLEKLEGTMSFKVVSTTLFIALIIAAPLLVGGVGRIGLDDIALIVASIFVAIWSFWEYRSKVDQYILWTIWCTASYYVLASMLNYFSVILLLSLLLKISMVVRYITSILAYVLTIFLLLWWQKKYIEMKKNLQFQLCMCCSI